MLIFLIGIVCFYCIQDKSEIEKPNELNIVYKEMILRQSYYGGNLNIQPDMAISDNNGNNIKLQFVVNGKPKLVFRFTDLHCSVCIKAIIPYLKSFSEKIGSSNIILFVSQSNLKYIKLLYSDYHLDFPFFIVPYNSLKNDIENFNSPYLFIMTSDLKAQKAFIPDKSLPEITEYYLSAISDIIAKGL